MNDEESAESRRIDVAYFISFCIEHYKHAHGISGAEAMHILDKYGVLCYLQENFEVLHTQSMQWILEDIESFIDVRN